MFCHFFSHFVVVPKSKTEKKPVWITNSYSRQLVHKWRSEEQAILIGTNTALEDNPSLTVRDWTGSHPIRIVLDKEKKLDTNLNVLNNTSRTIVLSSEKLNFQEPLAKQICDYLFQEQINSVIIEGGRQTLQTFIDEKLWDEARVFTGESIHFHSGIEAPQLTGTEIMDDHFGNDRIQFFKPLL